MFGVVDAVVIPLSACVSTHSVEENVFPLKIKPTPTSKQPSAVVCLGVSRPVLADGGSSSHRVPGLINTLSGGSLRTLELYGSGA